MKMIMTSLLLALSLNSYANYLEVNGPLDQMLFEEAVNENKTYYETISDLFTQGSSPEISKIKDKLWSGRCFFANQPDVPANAAYYIKAAVSPDVGPIGNGKVSYEAATFWKKDAPANYYDTMTLKDAMTAQTGITFREVKISNGSLSIKLNGTDSSILKASGDYLVEQVTGPDTAQKDIFCYYFTSKVKAE